MTNDQDAANAFDRYLDGLIDGHESRRAMVDADLSRFARRVQATAIAPPPRPAFGRALRQTLLTEPAVADGRLGRAWPLLRPSRPASETSASLWRPAVEFAAMVLVIVAVFGGIRAGDRLWSAVDSSDDGRGFALSDASPAPAIPAVNDTCQTPPRTLAEVTALAATPVADPFNPIADSGGTHVKVESVHGIIQTLDQINACAAEGNLLAVYGNFSDRFIRRHLGPATTTDPASFQAAMADPPLVRWPATGEYVSIDDLVQPRGKLVLISQASLLGDGRVRIGVGDWQAPNEHFSRYVVLFVQRGDRWLIDEVFKRESSIAEMPVVLPIVVGGLPPTVTPVVATPANPAD